MENTAKNGENADFQHFLLFTLCFQKPYLKSSFKVELSDEILKWQKKFWIRIHQPFFWMFIIFFFKIL